MTYAFKNYTADEYYKIKPDIEYMLGLMSVDKLKENYTVEGFLKDNPLFFSIIYKDGEPYEASNVISRNCFNNGCRVLNRLMVDPNKRDKTPTAKIPNTTLTMLQSQLDFAKNNFDFAFISREFNTYRFCKRFAKDCNNFLNYFWQYETEKFLVCEWKKDWGHPDDSCWQSIAWTKFKNIDIFPLQSWSSFH